MMSRWIRLWDCLTEWYFGQINGKYRRVRSKVLIGMFIYRVWDGSLSGQLMGVFHDMGIVMS